MAEKLNWLLPQAGGVTCNLCGSESKLSVERLHSGLKRINFATHIAVY
jgi:hypothetical protein